MRVFVLFVALESGNYPNRQMRPCHFRYDYYYYYYYDHYRFREDAGTMAEKCPQKRDQHYTRKSRQSLLIHQGPTHGNIHIAYIMLSNDDDAIYN